jgi:hypothetical protein
MPTLCDFRFRIFLSTSAKLEGFSDAGFLFIAFPVLLGASSVSATGSTAVTHVILPWAITISLFLLSGLTPVRERCSSSVLQFL